MWNGVLLLNFKSSLRPSKLNWALIKVKLKVNNIFFIKLNQLLQAEISLNSTFRKIDSTYCMNKNVELNLECLYRLFFNANNWEGIGVRHHEYSSPVNDNRVHHSVKCLHPEIYRPSKLSIRAKTKFNVVLGINPKPEDYVKIWKTFYQTCIND